MVGGQGLDFEDVEAGSRNLSGVQRCHKVGEAHSHATADIDQKSTSLHTTKPLAVNEALGGGGVRDCHNEEVGLRQKFVELFRAVKLLHFLWRMGAPAIHADDAHAKRMTQTGGFATDATDAEDQGCGFG